MEFFDERIDKELFARLENVLNNPFKRVPYTEAVDILAEVAARRGSTRSRGASTCNPNTNAT